MLTLELPEDDRFFDDKADILELAGLGATASFNLIPNREPTAELFAFLRLLNLSGEESLSKRLVSMFLAWAMLV